jgi:4-hydroxyproline epimerase
VWTQASVIGSTFQASYERADASAAEDARIIPTLRGSAYVCAEATLLIDDADPFAWGIRAA